MTAASSAVRGSLGVRLVTGVARRCHGESGGLQQLWWPEVRGALADPHARCEHCGSWRSWCEGNGRSGVRRAASSVHWIATQSSASLMREPKSVPIQRFCDCTGGRVIRTLPVREHGGPGGGCKLTLIWRWNAHTLACMVQEHVWLVSCHNCGAHQDPRWHTKYGHS